MKIINSKALIIMKNVKKLYSVGEKEFWALKGIDLDINKGELLAIVGKSGSGKSTLLNLLGGIDTPTEGSIIINGNELNGMKENQLSHFRSNNIGFIFQFFQLMPTLTVLENILMPMDFSNKIASSKRRERAKMLLNKVDMINHADKFPSSLSGGEQQRVAVARALANDPDIIFADEPTGNLDSNTAEEIFRLLKSITEEGKTVIMVTHNNELAERCKRIVKIKDGQIVEEILNDYEMGNKL